MLPAHDCASIRSFVASHDTIVAMYSSQVLDHFEHPRNAGQIENPDGVAQIENPACGDILKLSLRVSDNTIRAARFLAKGCVAAMACGSALTELIQGRTVEEAGRIRREDVVAAVGGLPAASLHASYLAVEALAVALKSLKG
jgi:nitrogen fixation NifU-like protein